MAQDARIRIGLYGVNGHQVQGRGDSLRQGEIVALAGFPEDAVPAGLRERGVRRYAGLEELLEDPGVDLVSLCSPRRDEQARDAVRCLEAGRHVYAEKPSATTERDLDAILDAAARTGRRYHEMAGTVVEQPYREMRRLVRSGAVGEVVQVWSQKSYPWRDSRPQDEGIDGGLLLQAGVYNLRFTEHIAGVRVRSIEARESLLGNHVPGGSCRRAVSLVMELENRGVAGGIVNYLSPAPPVLWHWGYESLRIFGTGGFVESIDFGRITRLVTLERDHGPIDQGEGTSDYLDLYLAELAGGEAMPLGPEEELHPTRMVIRAKAGAPAPR
jgi:predicted dehydrogenase